MADLPLEDILHELARGFSKDPRLTLEGYFELLEWAPLFGLERPGSKPWQGRVGLRIEGFSYALLFLDCESAAATAIQLGASVVPPVRGRQILGRLEDGQGVIVDYGTASEVKIEPTKLTELNELLRIKPVRQEATPEWLAMVDSKLEREAVPQETRLERALDLWRAANGFRVVPGSRRSRRIAWFFGPTAQAGPLEAEYQADPYLSHLARRPLKDRLTDVRANLASIDRPALPHELDEGGWLELFEHARLEYRRRGWSFIEACRGGDLSASWPRRLVAQRAFDADVGPEGQLYRFSDLRYLAPLLEEGRMKLFPASKYPDAGLSPAQRDDELARTILIDGRKAAFVHRGRDGIRRPIRAGGTVAYTTRSRTNFYLWCASTSFDGRLFDDFRADACLVIHDASSFTSRFYAAVEAALPGWVGAEKLVDYFDPLRCSLKPLSTFHKELRFSYQREFRFVWDPPAPRTARELEAIDLCLGSLRGIATLLAL